MISADVSCRLLEVDFAGIENTLTGWYIWRHGIDQQSGYDYIRWSRLGMHAAVTALKVGTPADPSWEDERIVEYLAKIKHDHPVHYDIMKRVDHGCVTAEHEVLTTNGWRRFDGLADNVAIAIWDPKTKAITFEVPSKVTRELHSGPMISLKGRAVSICATPEHRLAVRTNAADKRYKMCQLQDLPPTGRIPVCGVIQRHGAYGAEDWSDILQFAIAVQADGHWAARGEVRFNLRKKRKKDRLRALLQRIGWEFHENKSGFYIGRHIASVALSKWLAGDKEFRLDAFLKLSPAAMRKCLAEIVLWDGTIGPASSTYYTTNYHNAVVVQTLAHLSGSEALLRESSDNDRRNKPVYRVSFNQRTEARAETLERSSFSFSGLVYCVSVSTEHFLLRHRDRIMVSGNTNYGLTLYGMCEMFPDYFKTPKEAQDAQGYLFALAPGLPKWHTALRMQAREVGFLGGPTPPGAIPGRWDHPFGYRHWFWDVLSYKPTDEVTARAWLRDPRRASRITIMHGRYFKIDWGGDSKRTIAFYPQSTGAGVLKLVELLLFADPDSPDYIGDAYFGRTPLLGPIHDALLLHVPNRIYDRVLEIVVRVMQSEVFQLPCPPEWNLGPFLRFGVEAKGGAAWDKKSMQKIKTPPLVVNVPHPEDSPMLPREDDDASVDDWSSLRAVV